MTIHVHVYDDASQADDNLVVCKDLELRSTYDEYEQYGFQLDDKWIEIRVPLTD